MMDGVASEDLSVALIPEDGSSHDASKRTIPTACSENEADAAAGGGGNSSLSTAQPDSKLSAFVLAVILFFNVAGGSSFDWFEFL